jgi:hypothetical protein
MKHISLQAEYQCKTMGGTLNANGDICTIKNPEKNDNPPVSLAQPWNKLFSILFIGTESWVINWWCFQEKPSCSQKGGTMKNEECTVDIRNSSKCLF